MSLIVQFTAIQQDNSECECECITYADTADNMLLNKKSKVVCLLGI